MKKYVAPMLFVDKFVADTMITSSGGNPKNGNADNNQNCWGCNQTAGAVDGENACTIISGTEAYDMFC